MAAFSSLIPKEFFPIAGFGQNHWSAIVEVQAMYGGLQMAVGFFALIGALKPQKYMHSALLLWAITYSFLAVGRIVGLSLWGENSAFAIDLAIESLPNSYNSGALWLWELPNAILFTIALIKTNKIT